MTLSTHWRVNTEDLLAQFDSQQDCIQQSLPDELGVGYSSIFQLDSGLSYIETHCTPVKALAIVNHIDTQEPRIVVTLALKGQSCFAGYQREELVFKQGYVSIASVRTSSGERRYQAQQAITQLRFSLSKTWLSRYFGDALAAQLLTTDTMQLLSCRPISSQGINAAQQLLTYPVKPEMRRVFMHAHALSLLTTELSGLYQEKTKFTPRDKAIAFIARDILHDEFQQPPTIAELAKRVGTNSFKLKQLFQYFFNNTPYGVLLEIRMNKAHQLLATTQCQVSAAAEFVGYSHANNFSVAFSKYFGVTPKVIAKQ